ncbi:SHOCT domain-containing protein [Streptomyces sp. NBC_00454]|uniref:SHOCT domain-containing protein n=1 Tax=Streptomyces sp. NBC_00454 TaxID=2975747 RepID=UPI00352C31ED
MGRPGLLGAMARTAVVAGTATAVSGRMQRSAADRSAQQQMAAEAQQQAAVDQAAAQAAAQLAASRPTSAPAAQAPVVDRVGQLTALAELKAQGLLTDEEFTAEKARVLAS